MESKLSCCLRLAAKAIRDLICSREFEYTKRLCLERNSSRLAWRHGTVASRETRYIQYSDIFVSVNSMQPVFCCKEQLQRFCAFND